MEETPGDRAIKYLKSCAAQIAPFWSAHYDARVPPEEVINFFDESVASIIAAEPELLAAFGWARSQTDKLNSDLLDIVIYEARLEVRKILDAKAKDEHERQSKSRIDRIASLNECRVARLAAAPDADVTGLDSEIQQELEDEDRAQKKQSRAERLAYLRRVRGAPEAERRRAAEAEKRATTEIENDFADAVHKALQAALQLGKSPGAITRPAILELITALASRVAAEWPAHGGQSIDQTLASLLRLAIRALLQDVDPGDGTWDYKLEDGSIYRYTSVSNLVSEHVHVLGSMVEDNAVQHYSYEQIKPWSLDELRSITLEVVNEWGERQVKAQHAEALIAEAARSLESWQELHPAPPASPYGVSPVGAELWCRDWLTHMGLQDAIVTQQSGDGGVDIVSPTHIVQVKHYGGSVPIAEIRELIGVAVVDGREPIFMTSGQYPAQAEELADRANMLLFRYSVESGEAVGCTSMSRLRMRTGFIGEEQAGRDGLHSEYEHPIKRDHLH